MKVANVNAVQYHTNSNKSMTIDEMVDDVVWLDFEDSYIDELMNALKAVKLLNNSYKHLSINASGTRLYNKNIGMQLMPHEESGRKGYLSIEIDTDAVDLICVDIRVSDILKLKDIIFT